MRVLRWSLGIVGIVLLGALGSGAWELIIHPSLSWFTNFFLNLATLGLESARTSIYKDISIGLHEESAVRLLSIGFAIMTLMSIYPTIILFILYRKTRKPKANDEGARTDRQDKKEKFFKFVLIPTLAILIVTANLQVEIGRYKNRAIANFNQVLAICRPWMSDVESYGILSKFARIESKADYESVIGELGNVAKKNNLKLPDFKTW